MDVVRNNIEHLGGWVDVTSTPGPGTKVSLSLPLTLAIIGATARQVGARVCALPLTGVVETLRVEEKSFSRVRGHNVLTLRDGSSPSSSWTTPSRPAAPSRVDDRGFINLVVVRSAQAPESPRRRCLRGPTRDRVEVPQPGHGERAGLAGATVMADGAVGLVVDIAALARPLYHHSRRLRRTRQTANSRPTPRRKVA